MEMPRERPRVGSDLRVTNEQCWTTSAECDFDHADVNQLVLWRKRKSKTREVIKNDSLIIYLNGRMTRFGKGIELTLRILDTDSLGTRNL